MRLRVDIGPQRKRLATEKQSQRKRIHGQPVRPLKRRHTFHINSGFSANRQNGLKPAAFVIENHTITGFYLQ
jgi:hypothetical protein